MLKAFTSTLWAVSVLILITLPASAADFTGTWLHSDPDGHTGFRVYEKDFLTIAGDQAIWTRSMGQHRMLRTTTFYFKGPETCQFNEMDFICQVSETRLRLCTTAWNCDEYLKTEEAAPSAPARILDRADGRFVLQFQYQGTKYAKTIAADRLFPLTTEYPLRPVRVTLYADAIQFIEARITTYWIQGKSENLKSYATEIQLYSLSQIGDRDGKIGIMEKPEFLGPQKTFGFEGDLNGSTYKFDFLSLL